MLTITINSATTLILFGLLVHVSATRKTGILDQDEGSSSTETIAQAVCDITRGADKQISQFSTIDRLIQFFRSLSPDHQLETCAQKSLPALEQMQLILSTSNENVCASAQIELIEKFHRNFISKVRKYRKEQKANNLSAPKILKLFYLHYVSAISATCEQAASRELESLTFNQIDQKDDVETAFTQLKGAFGTLDSQRGYKGMYLLWNFIDTLPLEKNAKLSQSLHQGNTRLVLQMKDVEDFNIIHDICQNKLKPVYSRSLLSVIRLADLGFYPESQQLVQLLSSNPSYAHLYTITQMCETFLRIKAVQNASLNSDQMVVLSKDDTASLELPENVEPEIQAYNRKNQVDSITTVSNDPSQRFIKKVKANVDSRVEEHSKILKGLIRRFKGDASKDTNEFILSYGAHRENLNTLLEKSLPKLDQSDPLGQIEEDEESNENAIARKRRGILNYIERARDSIILCFAIIGYYIAWLVLFVLKLTILAPLILVFAFFCVVTQIDCYKVGNALNYVAKWKLPTIY